MKERRTFRIDFMRFYRQFVLLTLLIIVVGFGLLIFKGLNLGIDFTGGNILRVTFSREFTAHEVREALADKGHAGAVIQSTGNRGMLIREQVRPESSGDLRSELMNALKTLDDKVKMDSFELIGPTVGNELSRQAVMATAVAMMCILIYIAFRFRFRFAAVSVIALVHDTGLMLGLFCIMQQEVSISFIAAILTTVGYSLNDSIVILDRVREHWGERVRLGYRELFNQAINDTLGRTMNTKLTTLLSILAFYIWGGPMLSAFSLAIIIGIFAGAFSSTCMVCSLLLWWYERVPEKVK